jgi:hypothetical protein
MMAEPKDMCEKCSNPVGEDFLESARFGVTGEYCIDCHNLCIEESKLAVKVIRARTKGKQKLYNKVNKEEAYIEASVSLTGKTPNEVFNRKINHV